MRKLACIKRISEIQPIEGKDRIVLATVDGWHVIVKKGEFQVGDQCVYVEIDSVMPERPEFEFLRSKKFRIKTMKLGNVVSQGICFPMSILPSDSYQNEQDVTEVLGVKQYEGTMDADPVAANVKPAKKYPNFLMRMEWFRNFVLPQKAACEFPSFLSKTDETRIQNIPFILESDEEWVATEKIDGQSGTFALVREKSKFPFGKARHRFIVCSRNRQLPVRDGSSYWSVAEKYHIKDALTRLMAQLGVQWIAIQGECIGPKIQGNKYQVSDYDLFVFNLITPSGRLPSASAKALVEEAGLKFVPIISCSVRLSKTVEEVLTYAHGTSALCNTLREGIVFRSQDGQRSFKAVDPLFLLQHDE